MMPENEYENKINNLPADQNASKILTKNPCKHISGEN